MICISTKPISNVFIFNVTFLLESTNNRTKLNSPALVEKKGKNDHEIPKIIVIPSCCNVYITGVCVLRNSFSFYERLVWFGDIKWVFERFDLHFLRFSLCLLFCCRCCHWPRSSFSLLCPWCWTYRCLRPRIKQNCEFFF